MKNQITPSVTNPTIAVVYGEISSGLLILQPEFQRKFVWTTEHQEEFIDTILNGYPFPEVYICTGEIDLESMKTTRKVIDGQQRLTTIRNYIEGVAKMPFNKVPTYQELPDAQKRQFLSYQIVTRDIGIVDDASVREIFRRINLTKFKLEDVEIHNAVYDGEFIKTAKDILDSVEMSDYGVFKESEFTRMADLHFILLIMSTIEGGGYFAQDKDVENKISEFNNEYPNKENMKSLLTKTLSLIESIKLPQDSIWIRKSNFFTLVSGLAFQLQSGASVDTNDLLNRLLDLERRILEKKQDSSTELGKYYSYMFQGTQNRAARVTRAEIFTKYIFQSNPKS